MFDDQPAIQIASTDSDVIRDDEEQPNVDVQVGHTGRPWNGTPGDHRRDEHEDWRKEEDLPVGSDRNQHFLLHQLERVREWLE